MHRRAPPAEQWGGDLVLVKPVLAWGGMTPVAWFLAK